MTTANCEHTDFVATVTVNRLADSGRFTADIRIDCKECGLPFRFLGLPLGLDLDGAAMSVDALEARLAIAPGDGLLPPLRGGLRGFSIRASEPPGTDEGEERTLAPASREEWKGRVVIRFDGPPGPVSGRFVEVGKDGRSISYGTWHPYGNDWLLVLPKSEPPGEEGT